jgi:predicted nucleic acid-binding protein
MLIERVVINSSPLIVLFRSGLSELLPQLFKTIIVPDQVYEEVVTCGKDDAVKRELPKAPWIDRKKLKSACLMRPGILEMVRLRYSLMR